MPTKNATHSGISSSIPEIPDEVLALFGDPPLLRGEDDSLYYKLMERFTKLVGPKDMIEWWWVKDMTDHTWEIRRLRRFKVFFIELQRDQTQEDRETDALFKNVSPCLCPTAKRTGRGVVDRYQDVDKLIASAELRRNHTLREIERRRENLAQRLRNASSELIDNELAELSQAAG